MSRQALHAIHQVGGGRAVVLAAARVAHALVAFEAHQVDLEREKIDGRGFDVVVFADVLEHLRDPGSVLKSARGAQRTIVSLPNIGNWTARRQIVAGRFPLDDFGLFDRTHLRFFTRSSAEDLLLTSGWTVTAKPPPR